MLNQLNRRRDTAKSFIRRPSTVSEDETSVDVSSVAPPPLQSSTAIYRGRSLYRPERGHARAPLLNPEGEPDDPFSVSHKPRWWRMWWHYLALICTFWAPAPLLSLIGLHTAAVRQAWREKITLVLLSCSLGGIIAFITVGLQRTLCGDQAEGVFVNVKRASGYVGVLGEAYSTANSKFPEAFIYDQIREHSGLDVSQFFEFSEDAFPACKNINTTVAKPLDCADADGKKIRCLDKLRVDNLESDLGLKKVNQHIGYDWEDLVNGNGKLLAIDGYVLNFNAYLATYTKPIPNDPVDKVIRNFFSPSSNYTDMSDATRLFTIDKLARDAIPCLKQRYQAGRVNYKTTGCFMADLILYISLIVILGLVFARTIMAVWYAFVGSRRLASTPPPPGKFSATGMRRPRPKSHVAMPDGATHENSMGVAPWAQKGIVTPTPASSKNLPNNNVSLMTPASMTPEDIGNDPYIVCLVTCYSEGLDGISATLSSLSATEYPTNRKLIFVVADGMITGKGESMSTPDVCVSLMTPDMRFGTPTPMKYRSVSSGKKAQNMALVYAGHYQDPSGGESVPMVVVVKCGMPEEAAGQKAGNRGKRDSQMVLMSFFQHVTYNDPMSPLDYDLFRKIHALMGVTPDFFEMVLMVDADTKVHPPALRYLANAMLNDHRIMGACGETRIQNKLQSWVTAIQVFEYFISHHQVKAFEAVFGGVTCLPGCFSMYRIKARKPGFDDWIPVIVKQDIIREYSQTIVTTLHQKNLLLLGEDRFLSTLMLRTFPHRRMVFVPHAVCHTEVPHTLRMLLSQRRRWINSTVHNLMELLLVRDLCGTFCFSMQFVVLMDLIGTLVLPVAISLTYYLIIMSAKDPPKDFTSAIPLMMLLVVLFLPGFIIAMVRFSPSHVIWLVIYLIFLPVWNFLLPAYSFWHFDDFSWGETRRIEGETKSGAHETSEEGYHAALEVPMRLWTEWETSRIRKQERNARRRQEMEHQFGGGFHNDVDPRHDAGLRLADLDRPCSPMSQETSEDQWGDHIDGYDENAPLPDLMHSARPLSMIAAQGGGTVQDDDLENILQGGWDDDGSISWEKRRPPPLISAANDSIVSFQGESDPLAGLTPVRSSVDLGASLPSLAPFDDGFNSREMTPAASSAVEERRTHVRNRSSGPSRPLSKVRFFH